MTTTTESPRRNGVDTATLFATLDAVKGQNEIAKFQFRASNTWVTGTHSRSTASGFYGAMQEMQHKTRHRARLRPPRRSWSARTTRPTPVGVPAARDRRLPDRRHRQHRRRPRRRAHQGHLDRRGRHRPARDPRPVRRLGPQRLPADPGHVPRSRATPTTRPCAASSSSPGAARPSTTCSPTRRPSSSTWSPADRRPSVDLAGPAGLTADSGRPAHREDPS